MTKTLLNIYAHPDDESMSTGTTALALREGWQAALICATRGEAGEIASPDLATPENLGQVREQELRRAMEVIGIRDFRFLGYRDSGMDGTPENKDPLCLVQAEPEAVADLLYEHMLDLRPDLVITFEPYGIYGHPDHIAISKHTTTAFKRAVDTGLSARLLYAGMPVSFFHNLQAFAEQQGRAGMDFGPYAMAQAGKFAKSMTHQVDTTPVLKEKLDSLQCHRTQMGPNSPFAQISPENAESLIGSEYFAQAHPPPVGGVPLQTSLF